jgi:hypothetical protein
MVKERSTISMMNLCMTENGKAESARVKERHTIAKN